MFGLVWTEQSTGIATAVNEQNLSIYKKINDEWWWQYDEC